MKNNSSSRKIENMRNLLQQCRSEKIELMILSEKREQLACSLSLIGINYDKVKIQSSRARDRIGDKIPELIELDNAIVNHMRTLYAHEKQALATISRLEDSRYRQLLELYYLSFRRSRELYTWRTVADVMGYSEDRIKHLHSEALRAIDLLKMRRTDK